jgi:hypothetical protein
LWGEGDKTHFYYAKILNFIGFKYKKKNKYNKDLMIYSAWYSFIWPYIIAIAIAKAAYKPTLGNIKAKRDADREKKKSYISLNDIYEFKAGDFLVFKNGVTAQLKEFSANQFVAADGAINDWVEVKQNIDCETRRTQNGYKIKYAVFKKDADVFSKKVKEFQDEMDKQRDQLLSRQEEN